MSELRPRPDGYPIKLVRDRTAQIINPTGEPGDLFYGPCPPRERLRWLRLKLAEELAEYLADGGDDELRDLHEVVLAVAAEQQTELHLDDPRGGFSDCVMMFGRHPEFDSALSEDSGLGGRNE